MEFKLVCVFWKTASKPVGKPDLTRIGIVGGQQFGGQRVGFVVATQPVQHLQAQKFNPAQRIFGFRLAIGGAQRRFGACQRRERIVKASKLIQQHCLRQVGVGCFGFLGDKLGEHLQRHVAVTQDVKQAGALKCKAARRKRHTGHASEQILGFGIDETARMLLSLIRSVQKRPSGTFAVAYRKQRVTTGIGRRPQRRQRRDGGFEWRDRLIGTTAAPSVHAAK